MILSSLGNIGLSITANLLTDLMKGNPSIDNEVKSAFKAALKKWCKNEQIRDRYLIKVNSFLNTLIENKNLPSQVDPSIEKLFNFFEYEIARSEDFPILGQP